MKNIGNDPRSLFNGNHFSSYYYEEIVRIDGFSRAPEIDFRYEIKARKVEIDFKFDALYS